MGVRIFCTSVFFFVMLSTVQAQDKKGVENVVYQIMHNLRTNTIQVIDSDILYQDTNASVSVEALAHFTNDTLYAVRSKAYSIMGIIGKNASDQALRNETVRKLLDGCKDKEASVSQICSKSLQSFKTQDFSGPSITILGDLLNPKSHYLDQLVQLAGFVGDPGYEKSLLNLVSQPTLAKRHKWAIQLGLARLGNEEYLNKVVEHIKRLQINDDVIYEAGPALIYVRSRESIDYLFHIIQSDNKNCESANPDSNAKILCAYRALEYVTPVVKGFPLVLDASGDLDVKDYEKALNEVRAWYSVHKDSYEILKDTF